MNDLSRFANALVEAREDYEAETRADLLRKIESICSRWRHPNAGWDIAGTREEKDEGFYTALDLLSECAEEMRLD